MDSEKRIRSKNRKDGELKQELIEAGFAVTADKGLENVTLRKVADSCKVSHNTPYKVFQNEDELFQAMDEWLGTKVISIIEECRSAQTPQAAAIFQIYAFFSQNHRYLPFACSPKARSLRIGFSDTDTPFAVFKSLDNQGDIKRSATLFCSLAGALLESDKSSGPEDTRAVLSCVLESVTR